MVHAGGGGQLPYVGKYRLPIIRPLPFNAYLRELALFTLCGTHALERVGEMISQKMQKGWLFDSVDEKGVLVKSVEQGWCFRSYGTPNIEKKRERPKLR